MRKEFALPEEDTEYLESTGLEWECINDGRHKWLLVHSFPVPDGYNVNEVSVALRIDPGYPISQIDMAYLFPALILTNGKNIAALASQPIDGRIWQRWSRHRTGQNPWRSGIDNISTHLQLVTHWFERELIK